jgi:hypothetical protein
VTPQNGLPGNPVEQSPPMQARQRPVMALQMGVLPEHWAFETHSMHEPVVVPLAEHRGSIEAALHSALLEQARQTPLALSQNGVLPLQ